MQVKKSPDPKTSFLCSYSVIVKKSFTLRFMRKIATDLSQNTVLMLRLKSLSSELIYKRPALKDEFTGKDLSNGY